MSNAMFTALTALNSNETQLNVLANDVANLNTPGYKGDHVVFADLLSTTLEAGSAPSTNGGGINPAQLGTGVQVASINPMMTQGGLVATANPFDLAIDGAGFFVMRNGDQTMYTRDGSFQIDSQGNVVQAGNGLKVQGWLADAVGTVTPTATPVDLTIPVGMAMGAKATDKVILEGNLNADSAPGDTFNTTMQIYDSLGSAHKVSLAFTKTNATQWSWSATSGGAAVGNGTLTFDATGKTTSTGSVSLPVTSGAATPLNAVLDLTHITQLSSGSAVNATSQDGFPPGALQEASIDARGILTGSFSNGQTRVLGQVAIASFNNPSGLQRMGNNLYSVSVSSGLATVGTSGSQGRGAIRAGMLEQSNVDLANELTQVLVTERAYQAATKLITTADEMTQDVLAIKR